MGFQINTNVAALNAHQLGVMNNRELNYSLEKLSSGLRVNKAADDASGMAIADSLRAQSGALGQAVRNANDAIGIIQTADKAMDEQIKILDTIKQKAVQAAQDGQTTDSRKAIQSDILRLLEELDNIANTTSFNGQQLLAGAFTNREFQIGAYSNTTIKASIGATQSDKIGHVRFETSAISATSMRAFVTTQTVGSTVCAIGGVNNLQRVTLKFRQVDGKNDFTIESAKISTSAGTGIGALAEVINKNTDKLGVRASWNVIATGSQPVASGTVSNLVINGVTIGTIEDVQINDADGRLVNAVNSVKERTGVEAYTDIRGRLTLRSIDGRAIAVSVSGASAQNANQRGSAEQGSRVINGTSAAQVGDLAGLSGAGNFAHAFVGRLTLVRLNARDIIVSGTNYDKVGLSSAQGVAQYTVNLRALRGEMDANIASASGANFNAAVASANANGIGAGVTSLRGAQVVIDLAESAQKWLDTIRADLGSAQIQLVSTINNISVTQVNVKAAESLIRDVDFAAESANFSKHNILAQSGSFAMAQANNIQQNVLKLLQ